MMIFPKKSYRPVIVGISLGVISGLLSFVFLTFFNYLISLIIQDNYKQISIQAIILFFVIVILFMWSRKSMSNVFIKYSQNLFWGLRIDVLRSVLRSNYFTLNKERSEVHAALIHDVGTLTQSSLNIIHFITSLVVLLACLVYMFYLSTSLFLLTLITCGLGVGVYLIGTGRNNKRFETTRELERGFMGYFNAILNGFKEINMDIRKGDNLMTRKIHPIARNSYENNVGAFVSFLNNQITGQLMFYVLIASILLVFSVQLEINKIVIVNYLFILLYVLSALEGIMVLVPSLSQALIAYKRLNGLRARLCENEIVFPELGLAQSPVPFQGISGKELMFSYPSESNGFGIGPISFSLSKAEIAFIYGGNGSGKTTFIHTILGLLKPNSGEIKFNGTVLEGAYYESYKQLFSVVFNDFYLFDEFYGNSNFDQQKALAYLSLFEVEDKVTITATGFSTVDLSTGQRKRLALIAALLENKPIIVLDEWAADQDPYFRKKFYTEILPLLKSEGFTILAITHDDAYYQYCDRLYKMEYGKLIEETATHKNNESVWM